MRDLRAVIIQWHSGKKKRAIADFAKAIKVDPPRVSHWLSGRNWPDEDIQPLICKVLGITQNELNVMRPAAGAMVRDASPKYNATLAEQIDALTAEVRALSERVAALERPRRPLPK